MFSVDLDQPAPNLSLPDLEGRLHSLQDGHAAICIVNFWSCECDLCQEIDPQLEALISNWGQRVRLTTVAVDSEDRRELLFTAAQSRLSGAFQVDAQHAAVQAYGAQATPHFFVIDRQGILRYRGAFHNATFRQRVPTVFYLPDAVNALLAGQMPPVRQSPSYGCAIVRRDSGA
jgi:thiol-disulfide isomerase/thioredoxin